LPWIEESDEYKNIRADRANSKIRYKNIK